MTRVALLLFAVALLSACPLRAARPDDSDVNAALTEILGQYQKRGELAGQLTMLAEATASRDDSMVAAVKAAQAQLGCIRAAPGPLVEPPAFERFDVAQRQLSDAISRLLIESDHDRRLRTNPHFVALRRQIATADRRIDVARERYDEAAERYNARLHRFPDNLAARMLPLHERPTFGTSDVTARHRKPRTDFDALRGSLRV
jgi:LemA protein